MSSREGALGYAFVSPTVFLIVALILYSILRGIQLSFYDIHLLRGGEDIFVGFQNYIRMANDPVLPNVILNTFIWIAFGVSLTVLLGLATALFLDLKFRARTFLRVVILIPWVLPDVDVGAIWKWLLDTQVGILNQFLITIGIIKNPIEWLSSPDLALFSVTGVMIWRLFPFIGLLTLAAMQTIPTELYEAANVDGASRYGKFRHITLPHLAFTLILGSLILTIWFMNNFAIIWITTGGGPGHATDTLATYIYKVAFQFLRMSDAATISVVTFSIIGIFSLVYLFVLRKYWAGEI
ncbi:MAG: sugar ABC transporter permease [Nitrososphaerales archaeon]